jgi:hypothetical protein
MRAGKWGSDSPQFGIGKTLVQAVVQVKFYCPVAAVAYLGQVIYNRVGRSTQIIPLY